MRADDYPIPDAKQDHHTKKFLLMSRRYIILALSFLGLLIYSCGYSKPEKDKYPDMPTYPEHSEAAIVFTPLDLAVDSIYQITGDKTLALIYLRKGLSDLGSQYLASLDKNFKIIDTIPLNYSYHIAQDGNIYIFQDGKVLSYSSIDAKPEPIAAATFDFNAYKDELEKQMELSGPYSIGSYPDSLNYDMYRLRDSASYHQTVLRFKKEVITDLECFAYMAYSNGIVLKYPDRTAYLDRNSFPIDPPYYSEMYTTTLEEIFFDKTHCPSRSAQNVVTYDDKLVLLDKAVRGNGSAGGNHFVPGMFYPKGLQYYELTVSDRKTRFKTYSEHLNRICITSIQVPETQRFLVTRTHTDRTFETTYLVTVP